MKTLGFLTGAVVAVIAIWVFYPLTTTSDDEHLTASLRDHCIPYVQTGATPFEDMGRPVGVYDGVDLDDRVTGGGAAIVFDGRFVATWGEIEDLSLRICRLDGRSAGANLGAFDVDADTIPARVSEMVQPLGDLQPDTERLGAQSDPENLYQTLAWFQAGKAQDRGNRVVLSVADQQVTTVIVVRDLAP